MRYGWELHVARLITLRIYSPFLQICGWGARCVEASSHKYTLECVVYYYLGLHFKNILLIANASIIDPKDFYFVI